MEEVAHDAVADHERRMHTKLPPRRTRPITAVPFADWELPDEETARAVEMMVKDGVSLEQAALCLDVPSLVLERAIADYKGPYRDWLWRRACS